ncbi:MAG: hypothetical protein ACLGQH_00755 [Acidobacteriota bacterium]
MPCLEDAIATIRGSLTWSVEEMPSDAEIAEGWSNPDTRTHVFVSPRQPSHRLDVLRELSHAALCEQMPRLFSSTKVWGVSLHGHTVARKHLLRTARDWFVDASVRAQCPQDFDAALAEAYAAALKRICSPRPFALDRYTLSQDERQRLADGRLLAAARLWLGVARADAMDPVTAALAEAYAATPPETPTMPAFLAVANGLCATLGRRPFTPQPRKGYWMVSDAG